MEEYTKSEESSFGTSKESIWTIIGVLATVAGVLIAMLSWLYPEPEKVPEKHLDISGYYEGEISVYSPTDRKMKKDNDFSVILRSDANNAIQGEVILDGHSATFTGVLDEKGKVNFVATIWESDLTFEGVAHAGAISGTLRYYFQNRKYEEYWYVRKK